MKVATKSMPTDTEARRSSELLTKRHCSNHSNKRTIVITGVTSGLGRALLEHYYVQGHRIAGCGTRQKEINRLQKRFPEAQLSVVDVANDVLVAAWADKLCGKLSGNGTNNNEQWDIDLVIANAGISPETAFENKSAWEVPRSDFDSTLDINIKGVSNMIRHFIPRMIKAAKNHSKENSRCFVAMSSGLGRSPNPYHTAYCASKWAVEGMVKSLAMSLPEPLCAVPLAPGVVQTGMMPGNDGDNTASNWVKIAGPMILGFDRDVNGKSLSVDGFYTEKYKSTWTVKDGDGIPDELGHDFAKCKESEWAQPFK